MTTDAIAGRLSPKKRTLQPVSIKVTRARRRRVIVRPDRGSLCGILRENCGTSLFVLPILWTDTHTRLLGVDFAAQPPILAPVPVPALSSSVPSPSAVADALGADLTTLLAPDDAWPFCKSRAIKRVLATLYPAALSRAKSASELDLHFGGRVFRSAVRLPVLWKSGGDAVDGSFDSAVTRRLSSFGGSLDDHGDRGDHADSAATSCQSTQSSASDGPLLAYINRAHMAAIRQNLFRIVPGPQGRKNGPVARLQSLRSKLLIPRDADRDAYLVGVFVAMAQAHFYDKTATSLSQSVWWGGGRQRGALAATTAAVPAFHDVTLRILAHDDDTSDFVVYTATVTAAFLQRFAEPTRANSSIDSSGMRIEYVRVPVWPVLGLKERLGQALGTDVVGSDLVLPAETEGDGEGDDYGGMETWESQDERATRLASLKRKRAERHPLAEMLTAEPSGSISISSSSSIGIGIGMPVTSPRGKRRRTLSSLAVC